jgi:CDP-paratose 2-epimerase
VAAQLEDIVALVVVSGSAGLVGSEAARYFAAEGWDVVGIDNGMRKHFFGSDGSTEWSAEQLKRDLGARYTSHSIDIRDRGALEDIFRRYGSAIDAVIHAAGQPSHDWAAREPYTDFDVNAVGTLNMLESTRLSCPDVPFIFCSTNKVYGDQPNSLPLVEQETRWEIAPGDRYENGIDETMSVDRCLHSLFGVSKLAADVMVQEYGRYFGMRTALFRCGTITGSAHSAAELHGAWAYLMRCVMEGRTFNIYGYKGKQVRDVIHGADLVAAFAAVIADPRPAAVYNMGGGRFANCSLLEGIQLAEEITGRSLRTNYVAEPRIGDHQWWIGDLSAFRADYPNWKLTYDVRAILTEIYQANQDRWV